MLAPDVPYDGPEPVDGPDAPAPTDAAPGVAEPGAGADATPGVAEPGAGVEEPGPGADASSGVAEPGAGADATPGVEEPGTEEEQLIAALWIEMEDPRLQALLAKRRRLRRLIAIEKNLLKQAQGLAQRRVHKERIVVYRRRLLAVQNRIAQAG